jgi:hypothetical protein
MARVKKVGYWLGGRAGFERPVVSQCRRQSSLFRRIPIDLWRIQSGGAAILAFILF